MHAHSYNQAKPSKTYYNQAQTVITTSTSIPLVTHYRIAVSMTLKSEDKKKSKIRCCPTHLETPLKGTDQL